VSGTGLYGEEGEAYWTRDTGTEQYRFDIRWFPQNGTCGKPRFVAKARLDETGGAFQEVEWGTYDLNPGDEGFEYGGESSGDCPTLLTAYGTPVETISDPPPVNFVYGIESVTFCCGCANVPHCWTITWDFEFWDGDAWVQNAGSAVLYIARARNCDESLPQFTRLKCRSGAAINESSSDFPNDPIGRYLIGANTDEFGNTDTIYLNEPMGVCGGPTINLFSKFADYEWDYGIVDGTYREFVGDLDPMVVVRGSATWADAYPSSEAGCACP
jgi:hypothetical protein